MRVVPCCLLILILSTPAPSAQASPWHPIDTGHRWVYTGAAGAQSAIMGSPELFDGAMVLPLEWDSGVREYFSVDGVGRVYAHGVRYPDGSHVAFQPAVLRMDSDLTVGHEWNSAADAVWYDSSGSQTGRMQTTATFEVVASGSITVGAGTFDAIEILRVEDTGLAAGLDSGPTPAGSFPAAFTEYYAEQVGLILRTDTSGGTTLAELQGYGQNGVSVGESSLGALKSSFVK